VQPVGTIGRWGGHCPVSLVDLGTALRPALPANASQLGEQPRARRGGNGRRDVPRPLIPPWSTTCGPAACCLTHDVPLAILNLKDYEDLGRYHGLPSGWRRQRSARLSAVTTSEA
jgi:hypothetical protein